MQKALARPTRLQRLLASLPTKPPVIAGYIGAICIILGHWTVNPVLFITGFAGLLIQTIYRKQWNLVIVQINGILAWSYNLFIG